MAQISKKFIDTIRLQVKGGAGGMGLPKYKGIGGRGGNVYLEAQKGESLKNVLYAYKQSIVTAASGESSKVMRIFGQPGEDKIIKVPVGVTIYDEFMRKIGELNQVGEKILVAEGGPGGSPESKPAYSGSKGYQQIITIDLKLIADVGLVGFPNAGKSTLLRAVSKAKPKIAAYAFTTLRPNIGVIQYQDLRQIKMADLPGLVEGASHNIGMGHKFLKHVERSSVLLMVVDINGFQLTPNCPHRNCVETVFILNKELELFKNELLEKPAVLAINKMDLPGAPSTFKEISPILNDLPGYSIKIPEVIRPEKIIKFDKIVPISAAYDVDSIKELKKVMRETVDKHFELSLIESMSEKEIELLKRIKRQSSEITKVAL